MENKTAKFGDFKTYHKHTPPYGDNFGNSEN